MKTMMQENRKSRTYMNAGKRLFIILFSLGLAYGASAQRAGHFVGGGAFHGPVGYYPRTYVGVGFGLGFGYPWYPWGWYGPWYAPYPPYYYGYGAMPSPLQYQIENIKNDYALQIKDTKHDKTLPRKERRARVDQLEHDRDAAIIKARHDFYFDNRRNPNSPYNGSGQPGNGNQNQNQNNQPKSGNGSSSGDGPEYQEQSSK
jgi:hypothetical protein